MTNTKTKKKIVKENQEKKIRLSHH